MKQLTQSLGRSLVYWTSFVAVALLASGVSQAAQDGWTGIVWRNSVSGNNTLWVMAGGAYSTAVPLRSEPDLNWDIVGTGDMDGDGHFDLVFRHGSTGATRIWYMNDANYVGTAVICGESNLDWKIVAVADFDGDGKSDLLWRDVTVSGANAIWYMDGARVVSTAYIQTQADLNWRIVAASDFDSDNHPDIVWRHAGSGQNAVWHMNNATYLGAAVLEPESRLGWDIVGVADISHAGGADIVWRDQAGGDRIWFMDGVTRASSAAIAEPGNTHWRIVGVGCLGCGASPSTDKGNHAGKGGGKASPSLLTSTLSSTYDYGSTIETAGDLSLNTTVNEAIDPAGDIDCFRVVIPSAGTITAYTTGTTDTYGYWLDSGGAVLAFNDDTPFPYSLNFSIMASVSPGTYYLRVRHYNSAGGVGAYAVRVDFVGGTPPPSGDYGGTIGTAGDLSLNTTVNEAINPAGDIDCFRVVIAATGTISAYSTGTTDTYGEWLDSGGAVLAFNDDTPYPNASLNFSITTSVSPGTYYLRVRHFSASGLGAYGVRVDFVAGGGGGSPPSGLVAQWNFVEGSGTTSADNSGNGHSASLLYGASWATGRVGSYGLSLDGVDDCASAANASDLSLPGDLTIAFWMKKNGEANNWTRLVGKGSYYQRNYGVFEEPNGTRLLFQQWNYNNGDTLQFYSTAYTAVGTWYHVVAVREGTAGRMYINGQLDSSGTATGVAPLTSDPVLLGVIEYHSPFNGVLDDVRIYNRALSASEIGALYTAAPPPSSGPVAQWNFVEGSGAASADNSGNGHTATLLSGATWAAGRVGSYGLGLDGVGAYASVADASDLSLPGDLTISFWMKKNGEADAWTRLVGKGSYSMRNYGVFEEPNGTRLLFQQWNSINGDTLQFYSTANTAVGTWYHVAAVRGGTVGRMYINGVLDSSGTATGVAPVTSDPVLLGLIEYYPPFNGVLDDVRIYNRALSESEISALYSGSANTPPTISSIPDQSMNWNGLLGVACTVGDAETPDNLTVTATSSNTDLLPDTGIAVTGTGTSRTISLRPGPDQFGSTTVTVTVRDPDQLTATDQFVLTVNGAPTISEIPDQTVISGLAVGPISFTVKDWETPAGDLTVSASSSDTTLLPNIILGGNGANRTITVVSAAGRTQSATATIIVSVSDGAATTTEIFNVGVTASPGCPAAAYPAIGFENDHVASTSVRLTVSTKGGIPWQMAILVNSEDFANAVWGGFNPVPIVNLGTSDGTYMVWVGVRCSLTDRGRWSRVKLVLDTVLPGITIDSPNDESVVSTPNPTLKGHCGEELTSVTYDVYNVAGEVVHQNQSAVMEPKNFNETTFVYGETDFECVGLDLEEGRNAVVVHVTDLAGNQQSMTLHYTLNYEADHTAPILTAITWPQDGELISGAEFAVQGTVNDNSASVRAVIVGGLETHEVFGVVSKSGRFQIVHVPMHPGDNTLTVYAADRAGNESQSLPLTVRSSTVQLDMDPIEITSASPLVPVSGTVSDGNQSVSVNGVAATITQVNGIYKWNATVPITDDERPIFVATATSGGVVKAARERDADVPPRAYVAKYNLSFHWGTDCPEEPWNDYTATFNWDGDPSDVSASSGEATTWIKYRTPQVYKTVIKWQKNQHLGQRSTYIDDELQTTFEPDEPRPNASYWSLVSEQCDVRHEGWSGPYYYAWQRKVTSTLKVFTGSRNQERERWFLKLAASGVTYDPHYLEMAPQVAPYSYPDGRGLSTKEFTVDGQHPYCDTIVFKMYPPNQHVVVTPKVKNSRWYSVDVYPSWPQIYAMTRAYHPSFTAGRRAYLQGKFDDAAKLLGIDDDSEHCPPENNETDDVPSYADFYIINDSNPGVFPPHLNGSQFNVIENQLSRDSVIGWTGAHIKQVSTLTFPEPSYGQAIRPTLFDPKIIFAGASTKPAVAAHEWGHTRNLEPQRDDYCEGWSDGELCDPARAVRAIMFGRPVGFGFRNQIGRTEAAELWQNECAAPPVP